MKRGEPPRRKTPLKRGKPPVRKTRLRRVSDIARSSTRLARSAVKRKPAKDAGDARTFKKQVLARSAGWCEIGPILSAALSRGDWTADEWWMIRDAAARCARRAITAHHMQPRGMGGHGNNDPANGLAACGSCHDFTEAQREIGYKLGTLRRHG